MPDKGVGVRILNKAFYSWIGGLVEQGDMVLDVGCGTKWYWPALRANGAKTIIGIDAWRHPKHCMPEVVMDLEKDDIPFRRNSFDVVLLLDLVEHLERDTGFRLLRQAKKIARKKIALLTPLDFDDNMQNVNNPNLEHYGNDYGRHISLWTADDFKDWDRETDTKRLPFIGRPGKKMRFPNGYYLGVYNVV